VLADFHNHQIALGNSCKQIRKSGNPQILHAITDQYRFIRKKQHQILWKTDTGNEKCNRHQTTKPQCHTENIIQRFDIAPAPVLCPENRQSSGCSRKKHILDKLNLRLIPIDVKTSNAVPTADYININVDATVNVKISNDPKKLRLAAADKESNDAAVEAQTEIAKKQNELAIKKSELQMEADTKKAMADAAYEIQKEEQRKTIEVTTANVDIAKQEREIELKQKPWKRRQKHMRSIIRLQ